MYLSKENISSLKGFAILFIVVHNVVHSHVDVPENEFDFHIENLFNFFARFNTMPIYCLFSFYGWLGVSVFIFATGYGLTKKYGNRPLAVGSWIRAHYLKLFLLLVPSMIVYMIVKEGGPHGFYMLLVEQTLFLNIIYPQAIQPGVWWYLGMAFQLYVWFLLFRRLPDKLLILIAIAGWLLVGVVSVEWEEYVRFNSLGWMPEYVLGILFARESRLHRISPMSIPLLGLLIIAFSFSRFTFTLSGLCGILIFIALKDIVAKSRILLFLGKYSAEIYVVHAVIRAIVNELNSSFSWGASPMELAWMVLAVTILVAIPYRKYYNAGRRLLKC